MTQQGKRTSSTATILEQIAAQLPENWNELEEHLMIHHLMLAANQCLRPLGNWILVNGDLSLMELLNDSSKGKNS